MALLFELLLTAVVTLLAAFLLATFFAANDPRREPDRAAAAIAEEVAEEERIIEVDEVKRSERRTAAAEAEGWVEVEKAPAVVVQEEKEPECSPEPDKEGAAVKASLAARPDAGVKEDVDVGEKRCDLTAAAATTGVVVEADTHAVVADAVPREVVDVAGLESGRVQDVGAKQHDLPAEAAPSEVLDDQPEKQAAEVLPIKLEAVEAEQHHLVSEVAPLAEVLDTGLEEEESVQAIEVRRDELATETAPEEIPDVVSEKKEEQTVEAEGNELTAEAVPQATVDVPLVEKEEPKVQHPVEEAVPQETIDVPMAKKEVHNVQHPVEEAIDTHEEVQRREEAKCETHSVDQQEELAPEGGLVAPKAGNTEVSHEGSSTDKVVAELPVEVVTLQGPPEGDAEADMDFEEWEGIERSEVEKRFGAAAAFAASEAGAAALSKLNSDVQVQLQGLLKVAIDGPCYDSAQPLTLRPSSRAKWVAWQKLGNMQPEIAMEKYMNLLSEVIPGWLRYETSDTKTHEADDSFEGSTLTMTVASDQPRNRGNEESTGIDEGHLTANPEKGQSSNIPAE